MPPKGADVPDRKYKKKTVKELEALLRERDLVFGGTKISMISRLLADDKAKAEEEAKAKAEASQPVRPERPETVTQPAPTPPALGMLQYPAQHDTSTETTGDQDPEPSAKSGEDRTMDDLQRQINIKSGPLAKSGEDQTAEPSRKPREDGTFKAPIDTHGYGEIPSYSGLKALGLQLSDIKFKIRPYNQKNDDLTGFPPLSAGAVEPSYWTRKLVTFELPLSPAIQRQLSTGTGKELIALVCQEIWCKADGLNPVLTDLETETFQEDSVVLVLIKGWSSNGFETQRAVKDHTQGRIIWVRTLPLSFCRKRGSEVFTPGDYIHKWLGVDIMFSYIMPAELKAAINGPERAQTMDFLHSRQLERTKSSWTLYAGKIPSNYPMRDAIVEAGVPQTDLTLVHDDQNGQYLTIRYTFRVPRQVVAAFNKGEVNHTDMSIFMPGWGETIRETLIAKSSQNRISAEREYFITVTTTLRDCAGCSLSARTETECPLHTGATADLQPVTYEMRVPMMRQECAVLESDRNTLSTYVNALLCIWRDRLGHRRSREPLDGAIVLHTLGLTLYIDDYAPKEQPDNKRPVVMNLPSIMRHLYPSGVINDGWLLPGKPDWYFPMAFQLHHAEKDPRASRLDRDVREYNAGHQPPPAPEEMLPACLDLMQDILSQAQEYLETLETMEREFPDRMKELRAKAEQFNPDDFGLVMTPLTKDPNYEPGRGQDPRKARNKLEDSSLQKRSPEKDGDKAEVAKGPDPANFDRDVENKTADTENITSDITQLGELGGECKDNEIATAETPDFAAAFTMNYIEWVAHRFRDIARSLGITPKEMMLFINIIYLVLLLDWQLGVYVEQRLSSSRDSRYG